jgi:hypothetical protein
MNRNFSPQELDKIIGSLLEVARRNQNEAANATASVEQAAAVLRQSAKNLPLEVITNTEREIKTALEQAAEKMVESFVQANTSAQAAALAYENARKSAGRKIVGIAMGISIIFGLTIVICAWLVTRDMQIKVDTLEKAIIRLETIIATEHEKQAHISPRKKR